MGHGSGPGQGIWEWTQIREWDTNTERCLDLWEQRARDSLTHGKGDRAPSVATGRGLCVGLMEELEWQGRKREDSASVGRVVCGRNKHQQQKWEMGAWSQAGLSHVLSGG